MKAHKRKSFQAVWLYALSAVLMIHGTSHAQTGNSIHNNKSKEYYMSSEKNKAIVQKIYEQALNKRDLDILKDYVSDDYTGIAGKKGLAAFEEPILMLIKAFPDVQWTVQELFGEGDKVIVKWKIQGTHKGQFTSYAATGKTASNEGMGIYEFKNGKIVNVHVLTDRLGFLQQLEILPADLSQLANKNHTNEVLFIDKFRMPVSSKKEFYERMNINRNFIKNLPGFIEEHAYEYVDDKGTLHVVTEAHWQNREAIGKAKEAVQAEYKKQGFDREELYRRLQIEMDRGVYTEIKE
jgi:predicted ester cyclase/heme-degrading monooxygenase HmoA